MIDAILDVMGGLVLLLIWVVSVSFCLDLWERRRTLLNKLKEWWDDQS